jgi:CheY-like chemotaxis protein
MPRLLLVEDNEMNRDMLTRRLQRRGYSIITAEDGTSALARAAGMDLILMDLRLPDMPGLEVTRRLKADPATASIPIIALTAHAMEGDRAQALAAGCDEYEPKPIEMPALLAKIERLLNAAAPRQ